MKNDFKLNEWVGKGEKNLLKEENSQISEEEKLLEEGYLKDLMSILDDFTDALFQISPETRKKLADKKEKNQASVEAMPEGTFKERLNKFLAYQLIAPPQGMTFLDTLKMLLNKQDRAELEKLQRSNSEDNSDSSEEETDSM